MISSVVAHNAQGIASIMVQKFSVMMCVYHGDSSDHFRLALESIINQTILPDEIVLVVDGPVSDSIGKVVSWLESETSCHNISCRIIRLKENMGHGHARSTALSNCNNDIVAIADADDINVSTRFELQIGEFARNPSLSIVGGNIIEFDSVTNKEIGVRAVPVSHEIRSYIGLRCPFNQMTVMFRKSSVEAAGGYVTFYHNEDYYLWARMFLRGFDMANLSDVLVYARVAPNFYKRRGGLRYFLSEVRMQNFLKSNGVISTQRWFLNVLYRFVVQVIITAKIRKYLFVHLFRRKVAS